MQSATASLASAVDEERAKELLSGLGLMERVGVRVLQREQRKRDRSELLSRLQRARHNQLHVLSGPEQQQIKHIERHGEPTALALSRSRTPHRARLSAVVFRCFIYGALSATISGLCELYGGWMLDTSDGVHAQTSLIAPNQTCVDEDSCPLLPASAIT